MLPSLARFFEHVDIFLAEQGLWMASIVIVDQLRKAQGTGHASRAATDDDDIGGHLRMLDIGKRLAEDHRQSALGC